MPDLVFSLDETPIAPANETLGDLRTEADSGGVQGAPSSSDSPRKRRGRPPGSKNRAPNSTGTPDSRIEVPEAKALAPLFDTLFGIIASRAGDHWRLAKEESETLGTLTHTVLLKYQDTFAAKYGAEIVLAGYLAIVVGGRLAVKKPEPVPVVPDHTFPGDIASD